MIKVGFLAAQSNDVSSRLNVYVLRAEKPWHLSFPFPVYLWDWTVIIELVLSYSIINRETGQYMGVVGSVIPTENFFA
ncbi:MAG: hypothetical protein ACJ71O_09250, partial [Nitrososphaeraceae archaeon]